LSHLPSGADRPIPLRWTTAVAIAVGINALLFFRPLPSPADAASYKVVRWVDGLTNDTFSALREVKASGPVFVVACEPLVTWRKVAYYFPADPVLVLDECTKASGNPRAVWLARDAKTQPPPTGAGGILLPSDRAIVWLLPPDQSVKRQLETVVTLRPLGPLFYSSPQPGARFEFGGYWLNVAGR
jgi:hypothetical protein